MEPVIHKLRQGWAVSDDELVVVAAGREEALTRFRRLKAAEPGQTLRPLCAVEGCGRPSVAIFNVAWLCAEHCSAALNELRALGLRRPVEFSGDVSLFVTHSDEPAAD